MTAKRWQRIEELFYSALELEPEDRPAFVQAACAGDVEFLKAVERLLESDSRAQRFLETPPFHVRGSGERSQPAPQLAPGDRLGPYRIEAFIGAGGMGEVYRASDVRLDRSVAIKLLPRRYAQNAYALERFQREARAASALNHPNICTVHDVGDYSGQPFLVMELLDGQSLKERMLSRRLSLREILDLGIQIAGALEAAHARGIIHRDIKPANIFMTSRGEAKILDFGLAKVVREPDPNWHERTKGALALSRTGERGDATTDLPAMGTFAYMSPEQVRHEEVNRQTDLFSFGVTLYQLATGALPFQAEERGLLFNTIVSHHPQGIRKLNSSVPIGLERIIMKALEKDRFLRYSSAAEVRRDLERLRRPVSPVLAVWTIAAAVSVIAAFASTLWLRSPVKPPDRSEWIQITNFPDSVTQPALSQAGRRLTFVRGSSTFLGPGEIYFKNLPGGEPIQLTHDNLPKMNPVLAPDGSRVLYTALTDGFAWDTWAVPVSGGMPQLWLRNASGLTWGKSHSLLFSRIQLGEHMVIVAASEDGSAAREVYAPPHHRGMAHRSYPSPDGKHVLITEMDNGEWLSCRVVPIDGRSAGNQVGPPDAPCTSAAWTPDGKWIYLSARARDNFHLWRQRYPDGKPEQITSGPTAEEGITIDPDGRSLITSVGLRQRTVKIHDSRGERQVSIEGYAYSPILSPDGRHLYYRVLRGGTSPFLGASELWSADLESGHNELLLPGLAVTHFRLSPDGKRIIVSALDSDQKNHLWIVSADDYRQRYRVPNAVGDMAYFGPHGELIYHTVEGTSTYAFRIREDGTGLRKLTERQVSQIQGVSPDGKWVITMSPGGNNGREATWACATDGGEDIRIIDGLWQFRWQPDGKILYVSFSTSMQAAGATGRTYVLPLAPGKMLPPIPAGGFHSENDLARLTARPVIEVGDIGAGPNPNVYAFSHETVQRNLYRIPLR